MTHDAHVYTWQQWDNRRGLIRQLLIWHRERGSNWLRGYVNGWKAWEGLRADFWQQQRAGNDGRAGQWF